MIKFNIEVKKEGFNVKIGHIAVFTDDMETSVKFYELLGGKKGMSDVLTAPDGTSKKLVHMEFEDGATVELVEPSQKDIIPKGAGICEHFCFNVENVDETVKSLKEKGINTFDKEEPYVLDILCNIKIIFLTGPSGELIELFQRL